MTVEKQGLPESGRSLHRALDVLDAIGAAGLVVLPVEPTDDMIQDAAQAAGVSREAARKAYRAFLSSSG